MIAKCYLWFLSMMVEFWANRIWYVYTWCFDQRASLTCCDRKQIELQVYLIDEPLMRYDLNLLQFIYKGLLDIMCYDVEKHGFSHLGWLKLAARLIEVETNEWKLLIENMVTGIANPLEQGRGMWCETSQVWGHILTSFPMM